MPPNRMRGRQRDRHSVATAATGTTNVASTSGHQKNRANWGRIAPRESPQYAPQNPSPRHDSDHDEVRLISRTVSVSARFSSLMAELARTVTSAAAETSSVSTAAAPTHRKIRPQATDRSTRVR